MFRVVYEPSIVRRSSSERWPLPSPCLAEPGRKYLVLPFASFSPLADLQMVYGVVILGVGTNWPLPLASHDNWHAYVPAKLAALASVFRAAGLC